MKQGKQWFIAIIFLTAMACALPGLNGNPFSSDADQPSVAISSPIADQTLAAGQETTIQSLSVDSEGIVRVELVVNGQVVWVDANAKPEPDAPFIVAQPWTPDTPGTYVIQVRAYNATNVAGESKPLTLEVTTAATTPQVLTPTPGESGLSASATSPTPTPTSTQPPNTTPTPEPTQPLPTPTITLTPSATPEPKTFTPTGFEPDGRFKEIWLELGNGESRLGYPTGPEITGRNYAKQSFEGGLMFWWDNPDDPDDIWVLDSPTEDFSRGATSNRYADTWPGGDEYSCDKAREGGPVRGFGKVWCERPELQTRLGRPTEPERGSGGRPPYAQVQFFQGGVMIHNPFNTEVYVLLAQGDWQRFEY